MPPAPTPETSVDGPAVQAPAPNPTLRLWLPALAFFTVMATLIGLLHAYLISRLVDGAALGPSFAWAGRLVVWGAFFALFVGLLAGRALPRPFSTLAQWVGFGWLGAFGVLLSATAATDVGLGLARLAGVDVASWAQPRAVGVLLVVLPVLALGAFVARRPVVKRVEVHVDGLPAAFDGFRVVQLSDVHLGETLRRPFAEALVAQVNGLRADVVVLTGDIVDGQVGKLEDDVAPLRGLEAAHGVYFVTGNHEYYHGADAWEAAMAALGLTVLRNAHRVIEKGGAQLVIAGVPDLQGSSFSSAHRPDAAQAFHGAPAGAKRLLLAHQPRFAKHARGHGVDLMLSGHTHAGQIAPFNFFVKLQQPVVAGLHVIDGVRTYTSAGTGYWGPPFRVLTRGEVTEVVLRVGPK